MILQISTYWQCYKPFPTPCTGTWTIFLESHSKYLCNPEHVKYCCSHCVKKAWSYTFRMFKIMEHTLVFLGGYMLLTKTAIIRSPDLELLELQPLLLSLCPCPSAPLPQISRRSMRWWRGAPGASPSPIMALGLKDMSLGVHAGKHLLPHTPHLEHGGGHSPGSQGLAVGTCHMGLQNTWQMESTKQGICCCFC